MTEDQGASWRRIFDGGPGQQQAKDFAKGQGYAIGLALNPYRQGELIVTAGDRPPGQQCKCINASHSVSCVCLRVALAHTCMHMFGMQM